ncbi:MAG TPA: hypothetical protein VJ242_01140 [Patescibacteria group bacterium]|nr:hypothetical protein [Patescibacteria group bacterium]
MESISTVDLSRKFSQLRLKFITPQLLASLINRGNKHTIYKILERLEKYKILTRLNKGKYLVADADVTEFEIANYLIKPSYISLESALAHYGILSQFTYSITSVSTQKARKISVINREFEYSKITSAFFWGYKTQNGSLIADPEKACLDYLYLAAKSLRNPEINEWDLTSINKNRFKDYAGKIKFAPLQKLLKTKKLL